MKPKHTPPRSIRVPDALWQDAKAAAGKRDETLTHAITDFLRRYVKRSAR